MASSHGPFPPDTLYNSPFTPKLDTNYAPTNSETAQIKDLLVQPLATLSSLEDKIREARQHLETLEARAFTLRAEVERHQALLNPIRRIPDEVIQAIFFFCLPDDHLPILSLSTAPLLLTLVCRSWRALALSEPRLWSSIHIPIPYVRPEDELLRITMNRIEGIEKWFKHSGTTGLTISLWWPPQMRNAWRIERLFPASIMAFRSRIVDLELDLPTHLLLQIVRHQGCEFPRLRRIAMRLKEPPGKDPRGAGIANGLIWTAENLNRVVWNHVEDDVLKLPLNWEKMKELEVVGNGMTPVSYFSVGDARALLKVTTSLQWLKIQLMHYDEPRQPDKFPHPTKKPAEEALDEELDAQATLSNTPEPLILSNLVHLDVFDTKFDYDQSQFFCSQLQLPALKSLTYQTHYSTYSELQSLASLFHIADGEDDQPVACPCPLLDCLKAQISPVLIEDFTIHAESSSQSLLLETLGLMPLLRRFTIFDSRRLNYFDFNEQVEIAPSDNILRFLCGLGVDQRREHDAPLPCPHLEIFRCSRGTFTEGGLVEFVRQRTSKFKLKSGVLKRMLMKVEIGLSRYKPAFWYLPKRSSGRIYSEGVDGASDEENLEDGEPFDITRIRKVPLETYLKDDTGVNARIVYAEVKPRPVFAGTKTSPSLGLWKSEEEGLWNEG